ncbi:type II toxin-antitoxin system RelE/ParE family toxin [Algoriphagus formosus]|jgi:toxin ParE1/3/4|uniref:type II toxin-antitoxin system RelE/ParE family toxin n=1 Tax=Algoriphagus formosus TaxID=2007308 RepID=UPI000C281551|nr:type II toxin-antitoxin system RelE/ParE family toxin [Algoriphagus formosus]
MDNLVFRQEAIDDLSEIWEYTFYNWSETQADKYYDMLKLACQEIASNSQLGKDYSDILQGLKGYRIGKHIIFYHKSNPFEIEIIRILHQQMDLKTRLKE